MKIPLYIKFFIAVVLHGIFLDFFVHEWPTKAAAELKTQPKLKESLHRPGSGNSS